MKLNSDERSEAIFGAFDGVVSVIGFVFGLLVHHSPASAIAVGGLGGAIAATISMTTGEYESREGSWKERIGGAGAMRVATFVGSLVPVWSFFIFNRNLALWLAAAGSIVIATWIGYEKHKGYRGFAIAYLTLFGAAGLTLIVVNIIPASAVII
ncbi:MAG: VIT1/CCC1 transporter family protein [Actinobacteria bacterium]|nr:VIT1/CCC1 transporter family protein [Actinomycetota bacterium]MCL5445503.1 VIT1/CCC1 transporter family protein [Actinomycetota bacterium]